MPVRGINLNLNFNPSATAQARQRTPTNGARVALNRVRTRSQNPTATRNQIRATSTNNTKLAVKQTQRHALPFPRIRSRLATAIILGFDGCRAMVVSRSIRLSKSSRAYIISQQYLPGFVL